MCGAINHVPLHDILYSTSTEFIRRGMLFGNTLHACLKDKYILLLITTLQMLFSSQNEVNIIVVLYAAIVEFRIRGIEGFYKARILKNYNR